LLLLLLLLHYLYHHLVSTINMSTHTYIEEFCRSTIASSLQKPWDALPESSHKFLQHLDLLSISSFCLRANSYSYGNTLPDVNTSVMIEEEGWDALITLFYMYAIPYLAFVNLWIRLLAGFMAPLGLLRLIMEEQRQWSTMSVTLQLNRSNNSNDSSNSHTVGSNPVTNTSGNNNTKVTPHPSWYWYLVTMIASLIVMTDNMYVYEYGAYHGLCLFVSSTTLFVKHCRQQRSSLWTVAGMVLVAAYITWNPSLHTFSLGDPVETQVPVAPGLYYDSHHPLINAIVQAWSPETRQYDRAHGATPWMLTGDVRTGLPFYVHGPIPIPPTWIRVFVPVNTSTDEYPHSLNSVPTSDTQEKDEEGEVLALDIAFPLEGHHTDRPVYLVYHGINGGSTEPYVQDLVHRRIQAGSTVIVMVSRGLMDVPILGPHLFHGARWTDAHAAAVAVRRAMDRMHRDTVQMETTGQVQQRRPILAGVGYSMGGIVLNNYVASFGSDCALDAAFSISGALECRHEMTYWRTQYTWQPLIAAFLRMDQYVTKWRSQLQQRLSKQSLQDLVRATNMVALDNVTSVAYHGFPSVEDYYAHMGALGDIPLSQQLLVGQDKGGSALVHGKINNVSIPLCVLHALDDPVSTWRTIVGKQGLLRPEHLVQATRGNLMLLLTATGGHIGWPLGWMSFLQNWKFMNEAAATFVEAVATAHQQKV
jgi:predicted alpha/beta-fold hydrolase